MKIYQFSDYKSFIKSRVKSQKNSWGIWARLASAADCQPTYLSQSMNGKAHLTPEHIMGIARFWELTEGETEFFLLLLDFSRAGTKNLREFHNAKIERIRAEQEDIAKRLDKPRLEVGAKETLYYSAWYWAALHIIVSIPEYQSVEAISRRLMLPPEFVEQALKELERHQIVRSQNQKWKLGTEDIHIPKDSLMIGIHHNNWRQKAVTTSTIPNQSNVHYTAVYSISKSDFRHLKEKVVDLIEHSRKIVAQSPEEELICFACDLFRV